LSCLKDCHAEWTFALHPDFFVALIHCGIDASWVCLWLTGYSYFSFLFFCLIIIFPIC
jgi:hypothetical protein